MSDSWWETQELLTVDCWCGRDVVKIDRSMLKKGLTKSCDRVSCKEIDAIERKLLDDPKLEMR